MIQYYKLEEGRLVVAPENDSSVVLVSTPTMAERATIVTKWGLGEHNVNSALDPDEISRLEVEDDHLVVIVKKPKSYSADSQFQFKVGSVGIFLFASRMIVLVDSDAPWFGQDKRFSKHFTHKALMLRLLGYCTDHFMGHLKVISQISDELEQQINESMENKYLIYMFTLNKGLVYYLKAINSNSLLLQKIVNNNRFQFNEDEQELLEDLIIDNSQCYRIAEIYGNILSNMMDARASIVGNNLNILMNRLNIITIAVMLPSLVVSIFSMNVQLPLPQSGPLWPFFAILVAGVISTLIFFYFWYRKRK